MRRVGTKLTQNSISYLFSHGQNGGHFVDDVFKHIFVNQQFYILVKISLKFVPKGPIDTKPAFV